METRRILDYRAYIHCGRAVTAFMGPRVALIVDDDAKLEADIAGAGLGVMEAIVTSLERMLDLFDGCIGKRPPVSSGFEGRVRIEVAFLPGAGGLAHHGVAGIAVGPDFLKMTIASFVSGPPFLHQVFWYETMRNYIFPEEFTPAFDYCLLEGPDCWGWVNQGFVNVVGALLAADMPGGIGFFYYGQDREAFLAGMEAHVEKYITGGYAWEDVFMHERLPWAAHQSLDNVYSGLISILFKAHGGPAFLRRWFEAIPLLLLRRPASKADFATARDNFFLAACYASGGKDLRPYFTDVLRWPISDSVM